MKLSDYVVRFVADLGVKHVFVVTGGGAMHLNDSLARCEDLEFVCNHHEQACAIAAKNYSKATDNIGAAMVTTGPGGTKRHHGWLDSTTQKELAREAYKMTVEMDGAELAKLSNIVEMPICVEAGLFSRETRDSFVVVGVSAHILYGEARQLECL